MQTIYLDISNKGVIPTIYAKQGDVGRKFQVVLTDSGLPYSPASGSAFSVWYAGASGDGNYTEIGDKSAFSVNGNKVTVEMIAQMLSNDGDGVLSLVLNDPNANQISTWNIPYICESVPGADSEEAKDYYTAFSKAVENLPYPDTSLSVAGKAADAAAVGAALSGKAPALDWSHLKWYVMGDSLTAQDNAFTDKRYYDFVQEKTGIQVIVDGIGGTGYGAGASNGESYYDRVQNIPDDVDIVTIFGSGNDIRFANGANTEIWNTMNWLALNRPGLRVIVVPPSPWKDYNKREDPWKTYCDRLQVCALTCNFRYVSDMYDCPPFNPSFTGHMELFFTTDPEGIHPDENGHKALAPYFYNALLEELALDESVVVSPGGSGGSGGSGGAVDIPTALPNPHKLTFTGAVTAEYDGSKEVTVDIPQGGGGGIEVTGASVGQTIVVKAVDDNGKPTEWETRDFPDSEQNGDYVKTVNAALTMQVVGQLFDKPDERKYVGWPLGNVKYDPFDDTVNVLVNAANGHGMDDGDHDLFLFKMNPHTMDYTLEPIVKGGAVVNQTNDVAFTVGKAGAYTYGFCIDSNGDYLFMPNYCNGVTYLFRSKDHGKSWSVTVCTMSDDNLYSNSYSGLMQTSTGRLIMSNHGSYFWYSDDNGASWTKCATPTTHTFGHEACIVELAENELLAVMRKRWTASSTGDWQGVRQIDPAWICYSHDNGETWTNGVESKTITEMSSTGCAVAKIGGRLELYATSRYPHLDTLGVMYQHAASVEDALADNWSDGKVITYAKAKNYDDFGYPGCCVDGNGNVHLFWYDGDADQSGSVNYYYAQGYSSVSNIPVNADGLTAVSPSLPYSAAKVKQMIDSAVAKLNAKINQIIIDGGGTPEPDDGLGGFYVTDGLYEAVDFLDEEKFDTASGIYSGTYGKINITPRTAVSVFDPAGLVGIGQCESDLSAELAFANGVTLEIEQYIGSATSIGNVFPIAIASPQYSKPGVANDGRLSLFNGSFNTTSGANTTTVNLGTALSTRLYATPNTYIHVVLTITSEEFAIYSDGKCINSGKFADLITDFSSLAIAGVNKLYIGGSSSLTDGHLRCFRAYSRVLTVDEVENNYAYQKALRE